VIFTGKMGKRKLCILIRRVNVSLYSVFVALLANLIVVIVLIAVLLTVGIVSEKR
jgi:hypothetical protein